MWIRKRFALAVLACLPALLCVSQDVAARARPPADPIPYMEAFIAHCRRNDIATIFIGESHRLPGNLQVVTDVMRAAVRARLRGDDVTLWHEISVVPDLEVSLGFLINSQDKPALQSIVLSLLNTTSHLSSRPAKCRHSKRCWEIGE